MEANLKLFHCYFRMVDKKKKKGKRQQDYFQGLPTTLRHLNENSSIAFYDLLNRNTEFLGWHVSLCSI